MTLVSAQPIKAPLVLDEDLEVNLGTGYSRTLNAGVTWTNVGHISNGDVYKTDDQILTIEGSNIYEAYLVVKDDALIGFYLPVERAFSPLHATFRL